MIALSRLLVGEQGDHDCRMGAGGAHPMQPVGGGEELR